MIEIALLQYMKNKAQYDWHISHGVSFLRIHLMSYIDLWEWLHRQVKHEHSPPIQAYVGLDLRGGRLVA